MCRPQHLSAGTWKSASPTDNYHRSGTNHDVICASFVCPRPDRTFESLTHSNNYSGCTGQPTIFNRFDSYLQPGPILLLTLRWKDQVYSSRSDPYGGQAPPPAQHSWGAHPRIKRSQDKVQTEANFTSPPNIQLTNKIWKLLDHFLLRINEAILEAHHELPGSDLSGATLHVEPIHHDAILELQWCKVYHVWPG